MKAIRFTDELQLAPVGKYNRVSKVFSYPNLYKLTDIVRQEENHPLLKVLPMLRADVINGTSTFLNYIKKNRNSVVDGIGYSVLPSAKFQVELLRKFVSNDYKKNIDFARYGAFTNSSVRLWNNYIRLQLFGTKELIVKNDLLLGYKTIVDENSAPVIVNSEDYKVKNVISKQSYDDFKIYVCTLLQLSKGKERIINVVDHTDKTFVNFYNKLYELHQGALFARKDVRAKLWRKYFDYKNEYITMIDFDLISNTKQKRATIKKDLDYSYGVTIHKLQGSTVENIALNLIDICYYKGDIKRPRINSKYMPDAIDTRNRLLYTGISRASKMAYLLY